MKTKRYSGNVRETALYPQENKREFSNIEQWKHFKKQRVLFRSRYILFFLLLSPYYVFTLKSKAIILKVNLRKENLLASSYTSSVYVWRKTYYSLCLGDCFKVAFLFSFVTLLPR